MRRNKLSIRANGVENNDDGDAGITKVWRSFLEI